MTLYVTNEFGGSWNDPNTWNPKGIPGVGDRAEIYGPVTVTGDQSADFTELFRSADLRFDGGSLHSLVYGRLLTTSFSVVDTGGFVTSIQVGKGWIDGGTFTVQEHLIIQDGGTLSVDRATLKMNGEGSALLAGNMTVTASTIVLAKDLAYGRGTLSLNNSVVTASAPGATFRNVRVISGSGEIGQGKMSFINGQQVVDGGATLRTTGDMVIDVGPDGVVKNLTGSLIEAIGGHLKIQPSERGFGNEGTVRARSRSVVSFNQIDIVNQGTAAKPALLHATENATLQLNGSASEQLTVRNKDGQILVDDRATLRLSNVYVRAGSVTVGAPGATLIASGNVGIFTGNADVSAGTFQSSGLVQVEAGSRLTFGAMTAPATLAAAKVLGELSFGSDVKLTGGQKVEIAAGARFESRFGILTNVDEQITGKGTLYAHNLVNEAKGRIDGNLTLQMGPEGFLTQLTNHGTMTGTEINAYAVKNTGTMTDVTVTFLPRPTDRGTVDNSGTILNASFSEGATINNVGGVLGAKGAGGRTVVAGSKVIGGTLATSDGGRIVVEAAPEASRFDPVAVAALSQIDIENGATLEFGPKVDVLDGVGFAIGSREAPLGRPTTLRLVDSKLKMIDRALIGLSDGAASRLEIGNLEIQSGFLSGGGVVTELTPETRSLLTNGADGRIEATFGHGTLAVTVDRLVNDGVLQADNATLTIHVGTIGGNGRAVVKRGGTIDMSDARQFLGSLHYEGPGTILGPDLVPAGVISGFSTGDSYIFGKSNDLVGPLGTLWTPNGAGTGGTLTIRTSTGGTYANLVLAGTHYTSADFAATQVALADGNHVAVNFVGALHWAQPVTGNWRDAAKWTPTGLSAPGPNDNALIDAAGATYEVQVTQDTTVRSVATGGTGSLEIQKGRFTALQGTDKWLNVGTVRVLGGASMTVGGTFGQTAEGRLFVLGDKGQLDLARDGTLAGGTVYLRQGSLMSATQGTAGWTDIDVSNTGAIDIARTRLTADGVRLHGDGTTTVGVGATLVFQDSSANGGTLDLRGSLVAAGTVSLKTTVVMAGGARITAATPAADLANNGTIVGEGSIAGATLTLTNRNAIIADLGKELRIDTGANVIANEGSLFASAGAKMVVSSELDNQIAVFGSGGTVVLEKDVSNAGLLRAGGAGGRLEIQSDVANAGVIAAEGGGIVTLAGAIDQGTTGELVAEARGSRVELGAGSSVTGGRIGLGGDGALVLDKPGQASLKQVEVSLIESGDVLVQRGTLVVDDGLITADAKSFVEVRGSDTTLRLIDSVIQGGTVLVERGKIQVVNGAVLDGTDVYLDLANIVAVDNATLTNKGTIRGRGSLNRIAGDRLEFINQGTLTTDRGANDTLVIDTDLPQMRNTGKIAATVAGSLIAVHTRVMNDFKGQILSGAGTIKLDELFNRETVRADLGGTVEVARGATNEFGALLHAKGGTLRFADSVNNAGTIQATDDGTAEITGRLSNDGLVQALSGATVTARLDVNTSKLLASGEDSELGLSFIGEGGNRRDIVADEQGKVTVASNLTNSGDGRLLVQDGAEIEVQGWVQGGTARLAGEGSLLDLMGSADRDTIIQVAFGTAAPEHLVLGHAERFTGTVKGFAEGDSIDVANIAYDPAKGTYAYDKERGQLVVDDGVHRATIALLNEYAANAFTFGSDGHGGTQINLGPVPAPAPELATLLAAHG